MPASAHKFLYTEIADSNFEFHVIGPFSLFSFSHWFLTFLLAVERAYNQSTISEIGP